MIFSWSWCKFKYLLSIWSVCDWLIRLQECASPERKIDDNALNSFSINVNQAGYGCILRVLNHCFLKSFGQIIWRRIRIRSICAIFYTKVCLLQLYWSHIFTRKEHLSEIISREWNCFSQIWSEGIDDQTEIDIACDPYSTSGSWSYGSNLAFSFQKGQDQELSNQPGFLIRRKSLADVLKTSSTQLRIIHTLVLIDREKTDETE